MTAHSPLMLCFACLAAAEGIVLLTQNDMHEYLQRTAFSRTPTTHAYTLFLLQLNIVCLIWDMDIHNAKLKSLRHLKSHKRKTNVCQLQKHYTINQLKNGKRLFPLQQSADTGIRKLMNLF